MSFFNKGERGLLFWNGKKWFRKGPNRKRAIRRMFFNGHGRYPDLDNPKSLSEKLQWIKRNKDLTSLAPFVDKYRVRDHVKDRIGEQYLVPLLGVYDSFDDIDLDELPERFVMKATHGSRWNIFVTDKSSTDWPAVKKRFKKWLTKNYYDMTGETCYRPLKGKIIVEEYLEESTESLLDYKFYCCEGEPLGLHVDFDRFGTHTYRIYDTQWNEFKKSGVVTVMPPVLPKPVNLEMMLAVCRKLSADFSYVRVDLYNPGNRIYFSELTFVPSNGFLPFNPVWSDYYFGEPLDLAQYTPLRKSL